MNNLKSSGVTSDDTGPGEHAKSAEQQRRKLQEEIKALRQLYGTEGENSLLLAKQLAYNEVVDAFCVPQPRVDPMDKLPHEIWHNILVELSSLDPLTLNEFRALRTLQPTELLIPLTKVCRRWRNFLLSEPTLWKVISLWFNEHGTINTIAWQLGLSANLPLTIILAPQAHVQWPRLRFELLKHRERIQSIFLTIQNYWWVENSELRSTSMPHDLLPLPNLRHVGNPVKVASPRDIIPGFLELCPSVKQLSNLPITARLIQKFAGRLDFDEITTSDMFSAVYPLLINITNLRKVSIQPQGPSRDVILEERRSSEAAIEAAGYQKLGWTNLTYNHVPFIYPFPISLLYRLPLLTTLDLTENFEAIKTVIGILHKLPSLTHFKSVVLVPTGDVLTPPETILPNYSVRSLEVRVEYTFEERQLPLENARNIHSSQGTGIVAQMLLHAMPATEPIKLSIIVPPPFLSYALEGWERLETINIFCYNAIADVNTPPKDIPTTVKRFSLFGLKNVPFIIFSSSAEAFCCRTDSSSPSANVHKPVLNPTQWSAFRTLDIHGDIFGWKNSSVLHLKTIILRKRSGFGDVDNGMTSFVHAVACHSDYYPSLEEIVLEECPEWDILIIMLERRNLLASPPIKPITKITLPSICPPNIRRIIIDILKGKWPQRPSNKDLSPTSCVKSILDLTLPGCYTCHRTPRTCDEPIKVFWKGAPDYRPQSLLGLVEKYPHNEEEILNTWRERALVWEQFNQDRGPRKINCVLRRQYSSLKPLDANSY